MFVGAANALPAQVPDVGCSHGGDWLSCNIACCPVLWIAAISGSIFVQSGVCVAYTIEAREDRRVSLSPALVSNCLSEVPRSASPRPYPSIPGGIGGEELSRSPKSAVILVKDVT